MTSNTTNQIPFRYRNEDSQNGVTRETAKRMAKMLGIPETQTIHMALYELSRRILPMYEKDDGALTDEQIMTIREHSPDRKHLKLRASLFSKHEETSNG